MKNLSCGFLLPSFRAARATTKWLAPGVASLSLAAAFPARAHEGRNHAEETAATIPAAAASDTLATELATANPTPLFATPAAISILSHEDIRRSGATTLADSLRFVPGINVFQFDASAWSVSSRGFSDDTFDNIQLMIDGRKANDPYGGIFWDTQDLMLEEVDHIEILRGPSSTLLTPDSMNGVVNVVTRHTKDSQGLMISGGGGTSELGFGGLRYGGRLSDTAYYKVYGKYSYRESSANRAGDRVGDDWESGRGGARVDWNPNDQNDFLFTGEWFAAETGGNFVDDSAAPPVPHNNNTRAYGGHLLGRWTTRFSEESELKLQASYERGHRNTPFYMRYDFDTANADLKHTLALGDRHELAWGLGYRVASDRSAEDLEVTFNPDSYNSQIYGIFAQDDITVVEEKLKLSLGSKLQHNDFTGWEVEPNARLAWTVNEKNTLWTGAGRSVRVPTRWETALQDRSATGDFFGNPMFKSMDVIAYELGYRVQPCSKTSFDLVGFFNDYSDLRSFENLPPAGPLNPSMHGNSIDGESYGVEASGTLRALENWRLKAGYTFTKSFYHTDPASTDPASETDREGLTPQNQFFLRSSLDLPANVSFDAMARYVDQTDFASDYCVGDFRLAWMPCPSAELALVGRNVFESRHSEFAQFIEQSVYAKLTLKF